MENVQSNVTLFDSITSNLCPNPKMYLFGSASQVSKLFRPVSATKLGRMCSISLIYSITVGRASIRSVSLWVVLALVLFQIDLASSSSLGPY